MRTDAASTTGLMSSEGAIVSVQTMAMAQKEWTKNKPADATAATVEQATMAPR